MDNHKLKPVPAASNEEGNSEGKPEAAAEDDFDDDDMENSLSLAAIEAELKPKVVETFDKIADAYKRLSSNRKSIQPNSADLAFELPRRRYAARPTIAGCYVAPPATARLD